MEDIRIEQDVTKSYNGEGRGMNETSKITDNDFIRLNQLKLPIFRNSSLVFTYKKELKRKKF